MSTFALEIYSTIKGQQAIYKLLRNEKCEFDEFEKDIIRDGNLKKCFIKALARMQYIAEGKEYELPPAQYKYLFKESGINVYEIKADHIRIYIIAYPEESKTIILGGKKKEQPADLKRCRGIVKEFAQSQLRINKK